MRPQRIEPGLGQESVWDYPRPPRLEEVSQPIQIYFNGVVLAETTRAKRVLETSHPPVYYLPPEDIRMEYLQPADRQSWCEWKGKAKYYTIQVGEQRAIAAAWYYPQPVPAFATLKDYVAFYPSRMEACFLDGEQVQAQPGDFYGGWITSRIVGPFKGASGTMGW